MLHQSSHDEHMERRMFKIRQEDRQAVVQELCAHHYRKKTDIADFPHETLMTIIVDDKHKVLYCQVPKIACTNWRRTFLVLTGQMESTNPLAISSDDAHHKFKSVLQYLRDYTVDEIKYRLKNYLKFMIVREPLERLVSAYRNKFTMRYSTIFQQKYGREIIRRFRENATDLEIEQGKNVSFPEFVEYLLDPKTIRHHPLNGHWLQQFKLCFPCTINYNFIGRYENLSSDAKHILHFMGVENEVTFPSRTATYTHSKTSDLTLSYLEQVPKDSLRELYEMYYMDYVLFGYPFPEVLKTLGITPRKKANKKRKKH